MAAMDGEFSRLDRDIKKVAAPVLRHRVHTNFQAQAEGLNSEDVIRRLLDEIDQSRRFPSSHRHGERVMSYIHTGENT